MSARSRVRDTATRYGWELAETNPVTDTWVRGAVRIHVDFDVRGGLRLGQRWRGGAAAGVTLPQGRRLTVESWLRSDPDARPLVVGGAR